MVKKISLYIEGDTNTECAIIEVDDTIYNIGPVTPTIVKEYTDMGYELCPIKESLLVRTRTKKEHTVVSYEL